MTKKHFFIEKKTKNTESAQLWPYEVGRLRAQIGHGNFFTLRQNGYWNIEADI